MSCENASVIRNTLLKYSSVVCQAPADFLCSKMSSGYGLLNDLIVDSLSQIGSVVDGPVKTRSFGLSRAWLQCAKYLL